MTLHLRPRCFRSAAGAIALVVALASGCGPSAAPAARSAGAGWFGVALPPGLGDTDQPVVDVAKVAPPAAVVPAGEEQGFEDLAGSRIRRDLDTIVGFAQASRAAGDRVWGRVTGFPAAAKTMDWVAGEFRSAGLRDVAVQEYDADAPMWWADAWEVRLVAAPAFGAGSHDVVLESAVPASGSTMASPITAPLVDAGTTSDDPSGIDVAGKVAVQHLEPAAGAYAERQRTVQRAKQLGQRGAVAVLNVVRQTGNMHVRDFGNCGVPCFNLGTADGAFLDEVIRRAAAEGAGPVSVRLELTAGMRSGLKGHNAIGTVPARPGGNDREIIIVNAHADGWFDGAGDNGDGTSVMLALARHFARPEHRVDRRLLFVASGGHHSPGLNGPGHLVAMNPDLKGRVVLVVNLEHVAQLEIRRDPWRAEPTEEPMDFGISNGSPFLSQLAKRGVDRYGFHLNPEFSKSVPGDLGGYAPLGVARVQAIHAGPMYHTSGDVPATISVPGLERAARFYAFLVREAAKAPRKAIDP
jgi:Peptidase family M28